MSELYEKPIHLPKWNQRFDSPSVPSMRWIYFNRQHNGFEEAFFKLGSHIYVDPQKFWDLARENSGRPLAPPRTGEDLRRKDEFADRQKVA